MKSPDGSELTALRQHLRVARRHLALAERLLEQLSAPEPQPQPSNGGLEGLATRTEAWLRRRPRLAAARGVGIAALVVASLALWRQHDTAPATLVWALAVVVFLATWTVGQRPPDVRRVAPVLAAAFLVALAIRLFGLDRLDLGIQGDESATALVARQLLRNGAPDLFASRAFGIPTLGYVWFSPLLEVLPSPIAAVRATSALAGAATVAAAGVWAWSLGGMRLAFFATLLLGTAHTAVYVSHLGTSNGLALFFAAATLAALSVALVSESTLAAVLAAIGLIGVWCTWAGAREVLPVFALGLIVGWRGMRQLPRLGPSLLAAGASLLLLMGPLLSLDRDSLAAFTFPRSESALTSTGAREHTAQIAGTTDPLGMFGFQLQRVLSAFQPETFGDRSPFYHFGRPIIDPLTLILVLIGVVAAVTQLRRQRAWLLPLGLLGVALLTSLGTVNPPDYPRLSMVLPATALLAALPLAWLSRRQRRGLVVAGALAATIATLNTWWFFIDYPREGQGEFEQALLLRLADTGPVYVVTPDFYFQHETLVLLDPQHRIQPPPPDADPRATWIAVGPQAQQQLAQVQPRVPADMLRAVTDNAGRVVLYALLPADRLSAISGDVNSQPA